MFALCALIMASGTNAGGGGPITILSTGTALKAKAVAPIAKSDVGA